MKPWQISLILSITSLILYLPANYLPFMTIEMYGHKNSSTIWSGIVSLYQSGSAFIAFIVFAASILIPMIKIILLIYLSLAAKKGRFSKPQEKVYLTLETIGRWSMLDIFLVAILVGIMKLGHWTNVTTELGTVLFSFVVIFTIISSATLAKYKATFFEPSPSGESI